MEPKKLIESNGKINKYDHCYGIILSDGKTAKLMRFNYFGNPEEKHDAYLNTAFKQYCKKNNLKIN